MANQKTSEDQYPFFDLPVGEIKKFIASGNLFTLMLKNGTIVHHEAQDKSGFREWLLRNGVEDIKGDPRTID